MAYGSLSYPSLQFYYPLRMLSVRIKFSNSNNFVLWIILQFWSIQQLIYFYIMSFYKLIFLLWYKLLPNLTFYIIYIKHFQQKLFHFLFKIFMIEIDFASLRNTYPTFCTFDLYEIFPYNPTIHITDSYHDRSELFTLYYSRLC